MKFLKLYNSRIHLIVFILLFSSICLNIYLYVQNLETKMLSNNQNQFSNITSFTLWAISDTNESEENNIEIFNIDKGEVVKKIPLNSKIEKLVKSYITSVTGVYVKVDALPNNGFIIKVPFDTSFIVNNKWINDYGINIIDEVFILFPEKNMPYLLILDEKARPYFFNFKGSTDDFLNSLIS